MTVKATTVVTFNNGDSSTDYVFDLALCDALNQVTSELKPLRFTGVINKVVTEVKTTFTPGDQIYIQANKSNNVRVTSVVATLGTVVSYGKRAETTTATNLFTGRSQESLDLYTLSVVPTKCDVSYTGKRGILELRVTPIGQFEYTPDIRWTPFIAKFAITYSVDIYKLLVPNIYLAETEEMDLAVVFYIEVD